MRPSTKNISRFAIWMLIPSVFLSAGCEPKRTKPRVQPPTLAEVAEAEQDDVVLGYDQLLRIYDPEQDQALALGIYHLNQWVQEEGSRESEWKPDPLLARLPPSVASIQPLQELERLRFTVNDARYIHSRHWEREIAKWCTRKKLEPALQDWLNERKPKLGEEQTAKLAHVLQIFDWIVRNIQLDAFPTAEAIAQAGAEDTNVTPPERGVPGPGYRQYPHTTLLYGHGDALERARLLVEMCRQVEIDAVLLGTRPQNGPLRPWTVGVLLGDEMYLFDPALGLPIPSAEDRGVATLNEVTADPQLLRQLDVSASDPYPTTAEELSSLEVLLVAAPEDLSLRMWLLQRRLAGERKLILSTSSPPIVDKLKHFSQLSPNVSWWRVPFDCTLYELGMERRLARDAELAKQRSIETALFQTMTPLFRGRVNHLLGRFDTVDDKPGATFMYLSSRPPKQYLDDLPYMRDFGGKEFKNLSQAGEAAKQEYFRLLAARVERGKQSSSFWLGLLQYENEDYDNAVKWFQERTLEASPDGPWTDAARYNLARTYEAMGRTDDAIKLYRADKSPQRHGELVRAKRLDGKLNKVTPE